MLFSGPKLPRRRFLHLHTAGLIAFVEDKRSNYLVLIPQIYVTPCPQNFSSAFYTLAQYTAELSWTHVAKPLSYYVTPHR